jgi:hypothetical protein
MRMDSHQRRFEASEKGDIQHFPRKVDVIFSSRILRCVPIILVMALLSGCAKDTHERLAAENVATMKELSATLDKIIDEKSARRAKSSLESLAKKLEAIGERDAKLPPPTSAETQAINAKYGAQTTELEQKITGQIMRTGLNPGIAAELGDSIGR